FAACHEIESRERDHVIAPLAHRARAVGLGTLVGHFAHETLEVAGSKIVVAPLAAAAASTAMPAIPAASILPAIASATTTTAAASRTAITARNAWLRGRRGCCRSRRRRLLIDVGLDHDALRAAEEAALFEQHVV